MRGRTTLYWEEGRVDSPKLASLFGVNSKFTPLVTDATLAAILIQVQYQTLFSTLNLRLTAQPCSKHPDHHLPQQPP